MRIRPHSDALCDDVKNLSYTGRRLPLWLSWLDDLGIAAWFSSTATSSASFRPSADSDRRMATIKQADAPERLEDER